MGGFLAHAEVRPARALLAEVVEWKARDAHMSPAESYGVASFYAMVRTTPSPGAVVHVCDDVACAVAGAEELCAEMTRRFGREGTEAVFSEIGRAHV